MFIFLEKKSLSLLFILAGIFVLNTVQAQGEVEQFQESGSRTNKGPMSNSIYGKLVDAQTGKSLEAASVQLYPSDKKKTANLIDGMLSQPNGEFKFQDLLPANSYRILITALGYKNFEKTIIITEGTGAVVVRSFERDLGNISLESDIKQLAEVMVRSNQQALVMGIDRKVFNVEKSLVATGGTAIDVMKNIPSVSVDIDGNVQLRSNSPQIFVDGRPTILTLDQIPADHIDKIELITNPSAKFDAASSGGIINIILKKNKRIGLNGLVTLSVGSPELLSSNLNINLRQGKFNFFASGGINQSGGIAKGRALRENKENGIVTDYFNQYTINNRSRNFNSLRYGVDFFLNNRNTITLSQNFVRGRFGNNEKQNQEYLDNIRTLVRYGIRDADNNFGFNRSNTRVNYKYNFPKEGKELLADVSYNKGSRSSDANIYNLFFNPDGSEYQPPSNVWNNGKSNEYQWTVQVDYSNPVSKKSKIETGVRAFRNEFSSYYNAFSRNNGQDIKLPLSNNYAYTESINAAYFTYSHKIEGFSYQLGLRAEHTRFDGELIDSALSFGFEYPKNLKNIWNALFPSFFVTKKLTESDELQFNYTRRIRRPRFWQLNPFIDIADPANLRQGNPQLRPEFINSLELNYTRNYKKGSILSVLYFRSNPDDITEYSDTISAVQFQQLNNAAIDPNAILNTYINASTTKRYGAEFTLQHKAGKNFDITPTFNLQYKVVSANVNNLNLNNKGFNWEAKLISNYKIENKKKNIFNNLGFQLIVDYESPQVIPQGRRIAEFNVDFAIKKEFLKDKKASVTFAVSDLFNTRRWGTIYDTERFYQDSYRRWNIRNFRVSFSYKFGDSKFSLNRGTNRGGSQTASPVMQ